MSKSNNVRRKTLDVRRNFFIKSALVLFFLLTSHVSRLTPVFADEYHYNNILIGERASGMAGTYTAVSDDTAGLYYNPAGIVYGMARNISGSVNAYHITQKHYKGVIGGYGWKREASALMPNFFGIIQPLGRFKIGFSYAVPDSMQEDQDQTFYDLQLSKKVEAYNPGVKISRYIINFNNDDNTYNFGPSIATEITKDLSAGVTIYIHQRKAQLIFNQFVNASNDGYEWINNYYEINELGIRPVLGLMWSPAKKISLGLAMSKTILFDSDTKSQRTYRLEGINIDTNDDGTSDTNILFTKPDLKTTDKKRKYPLATTIGAAYFVSDSLLFSGDFSYYTKSGNDIFPDHKKEATWNAAIGTEYYMSKSLALRAGVFTNRANTPELKTGKSGQPEHIDLYGGSLSLGLFARNSSISLGSAYSYGTGKAQVVEGSTAIQDTKMQSWTIFLSSTYSF